jgi:hypothetical protein
MCVWFLQVQELRDIGVKTVWGEPSDLGAAVGSECFDVVLDNNGKTLDVVQYVSHAPGYKSAMLLSHDFFCYLKHDISQAATLCI